MKLLLDQGVPRSTVKALAARGLVAEHVADLHMATATDDAILEAARERQWIIVTLDSDFHQLLAISRAASPSVVRIRIEGLKGEAVAAILHQVVVAASSELSAGAVVSVTPSRIRVRLLPVGR
jgi:predicted nuclease of predicted toxin-antitoxin system